MSCNYAEGLSPYEDKGRVGLPEKFDEIGVVTEKSKTLSSWIANARHVVLHTGAGISTAAGIPDFRGPKGVWTLEKKGIKPEINISFNDAVPTKTHMAIKQLIDLGYVHYVVTQNVDGLHLKSGVSRKALAELHGNMFTEQCNYCGRQFVRNSATPSVGQKSLDKNCPGSKGIGRACRGKLHDTILDWEDNLPENDLNMADYQSCVADLSICLGTTLQIVPSGNLPVNTKKYGGRLAIINLQPTKHDKKADLIINTYVDDVLVKVMKNLGLEIPDYFEDIDPTKTVNEDTNIVEWTIERSYLQGIKDLYNLYCKKPKKRKLAKDVKNESLKKVQSSTLIEKKEIVESITVPTEEPLAPLKIENTVEVL